jgi:hypothetical protein
MVGLLSGVAASILGATKTKFLHGVIVNKRNTPTL